MSVMDVSGKNGEEIDTMAELLSSLEKKADLLRRLSSCNEVSGAPSQYECSGDQKPASKSPPHLNSPSEHRNGHNDAGCERVNGHSDSQPDSAAVDTCIADTSSTPSAEYWSMPPYDIDTPPTLISCIEEPFREPANFTKGCKWSPDGLCVLTCSEDTWLRIFNTPTDLLTSPVTTSTSSHHGVRPPQSPAQAAVQCHAGELVYDYCWYPLMNSLDPASCCFASSCRDHPVHLYDAFTGDLRATYRAYNSVDEVSAAYSVSFDSTGERFYAGFNGWLAQFCVSSPGRQISTTNLKDKNSMFNMSGIVSCFAFCPALPSVHAVATYRRSIGLFSSSDPRRPLCILNGQSNGVTHMTISSDATKLFSGGRRDSEILCWDLRHLGRILGTMRRTVNTNQRVYFDIGAHQPHHQFLFSGDSSGVVRAWSLDRIGDGETNVDNCGVIDSQNSFMAHNDCCNGVSCHPYLPVLATSSGQRHSDVTKTSHRSQYWSSGSDSDECVDISSTENCVKLWWMGKRTRVEND